MYRTARDNQLWDWNNTVHFGAAALRWLHECAAGKATRNALWPGFLILAAAHKVAWCAQDGVVKAKGGEYILRYRSAKRELQLLRAEVAEA